MIRTLLVGLALLGFAAALPGCQVVEAVGDTISHAAKKTKEAVF